MFGRLLTCRCVTFQYLFFEQKMIVCAQLTEYEYRLKIKHKILDSVSLRHIAKGQTTQDAVNVIRRKCVMPPL